MMQEKNLSEFQSHADTHGSNHTHSRARTCVGTSGHSRPLVIESLAQPHTLSLALHASRQCAPSATAHVRASPLNRANLVSRMVCMGAAGSALRMGRCASAAFARLGTADGRAEFECRYRGPALTHEIAREETSQPDLPNRDSGSRDRQQSSCPTFAASAKTRARPRRPRRAAHQR